MLKQNDRFFAQFIVQKKSRAMDWNSNSVTFEQRWIFMSSEFLCVDLNGEKTNSWYSFKILCRRTYLIILAIICPHTELGAFFLKALRYDVFQGILDQTIVRRRLAIYSGANCV